MRYLDWKINSTSGLSIGGGEIVAASTGHIYLLQPSTRTEYDLAYVAGGLGVGLPISVSFSLKDFPSSGSYLAAGPNAKPWVSIDDLVAGPCVILTAATYNEFATGYSGSVYFFGVDQKDLLSLLMFENLFHMGGLVTAYACSIGDIVGFDLGVSVSFGKLIVKGKKKLAS
jgi:hypothetical protein